jgi:serine/threonine-protein kinase
MNGAAEARPAAAVLGMLDSMASRYGGAYVIEERGEKVVAGAFCYKRLTHVIVKVLNRGASLDSHLRMTREYQALADLAPTRRYPQVFEQGEDQGLRYLVLEKVEGTTLACRLSTEGPLNVFEGVMLVRRACTALEPLHASGRTHRDLKPEHLVDASEQRVVILDLEDVLVPRYASTGTLEPDASLRQMVGTPAYMAPELFTAAALADPRADVYALGATLWELVTGQPPHGHGDGDLQRLYLEKLQPVRLHTPRALPDGLIEVVAKAIAPHMVERYSTVRELADALAPFALDAAEPEPATDRRGERQPDVTPPVEAATPEAAPPAGPVASAASGPSDAPTLAAKRRPGRTDPWMAVPGAFGVLGSAAMAAKGVWVIALLLLGVGATLAAVSRED